MENGKWKINEENRRAIFDYDFQFSIINYQFYIHKGKAFLEGFPLRGGSAAGGGEV